MCAGSASFPPADIACIRAASPSSPARPAVPRTVQHIAGYERQRRHATLVAVTFDLIADLTDQAIDLFDRLVGTMFRKAEWRHARAFQADGRAINEKARLYARVGGPLIGLRGGKPDPLDAMPPRL